MWGLLALNTYTIQFNSLQQHSTRCFRNSQRTPSRDLQFWKCSIWMCTDQRSKNLGGHWRSLSSQKNKHHPNTYTRNRTSGTGQMSQRWRCLMKTKEAGWWECCGLGVFCCFKAVQTCHRNINNCMNFTLNQRVLEENAGPARKGWSRTISGHDIHLKYKANSQKNYSEEINGRFLNGLSQSSDLKPTKCCGETWGGPCTKETPPNVTWNAKNVKYKIVKVACDQYG